MKKKGSTKEVASVIKKTVRKMLNMPAWAYRVQISTTRLESSMEAAPSRQLHVPLDVSDGAVGAGDNCLSAGPGKPVIIAPAAQKSRRNGACRTLSLSRSWSGPW